MIFKLEGIARRRSQLIADIDRERINLRDMTSAVRQDMAYATLGLMVGKLSSRHAWIRGIILAAFAIAASSRLMKKFTAERI
jgi:predicted DNA-binding ribbon-helix-helix protein